MHFQTPPCSPRHPVTRARQRLAILLTISVISTICFAADQSLAPPRITLQQIVGGLTNPVDLETPRDGTGRLFVLEQAGKIRIIQNGSLLASPFLNLTAIVDTGGEKGLLGMAFHPNYKNNGRFFVDYTRLEDGQLQSVIAEYHVSASDPNKADPTGTEVLVVDQPYPNHNGGQLAFGPDSYLYIAFGDGGSEGDPDGNGQDLTTLLGKILRIDINSGSPYGIPPDNPFADDAPNKGEIWAYGLRNSWRFSFDRVGKTLFAGDVGQGNWEEVDIIAKGLNYGWNIMEGFHCYPPGSQCNKTGLTRPITEYSHAEGEAIVGGYVYHGSALPSLNGVYVFADYISGKIWGLRQVSGAWKRSVLMSSGKIISSMGQDAAGELYILDYNGALYKMVGG